MSTVIANKVRQEGLSLVFRTNPTVGLLALTAVTDDGSIGAYAKIFRYSKNGVIFSPWQPLTTPNVTAIVVSVDDIFVAEVKFDTSDLAATATEVTFTTTIGPVTKEYPYFDNSLFKKYFSAVDVNVLNWYVNVLEKLYEKGLVPNYIDRLDAFGNPDDFLALFGSVTRFFAFYVELSRTFSQFYGNIDLISEFLGQRGIIVSPEDSLAQFQTLLEQYYFELAKRGTVNIKVPSSGVGVPDGELLRLIYFKRDLDEFQFCLHRKQHFGWNLGNSSPLHRGLRINDSLNKAPWSQQYVDMTSAAPFLTGTGSIVTDGSDKVAQFTAGGTLRWLLANDVRIDPRIDYQITFKIKLTSGTFNLALVGYDQSGNVVNLKSRKDGSSQNNFFTGAKLSRTDKYLTVNVFLYNKDRGIFNGDTTNIKQGQNLLSVAALKKIALTLTVQTVAKIFDFRILPMRTHYSRGFLQTNNFISTWLDNRNGDYTTRQLEDYISQYLIPYDCHIKVNNIADYIYQDPQDPVDTLYWVGAGQYCERTLWIGSGPSCVTTGLIWVPEEETAYCEVIEP